MAKTILERARINLTRKKYYEVINLLEPCIVQYNENFNYFYYLGLACLHSGDIGGATSYFQRARKIKMRDPDLLCAQAVLFLRRGETNQAVEYYLEALEYDPKHQLAKKSLAFLRKKGDKDTLAMMLETNKIKKFYPKLHYPFNRILVPSILLICIVAISFFLSFFLKSKLENKLNRADLSHLSLVVGEQLVNLDGGGTYRYILTEKQIQESYNTAQKLFQKYKDNAAQVEINRLLLSNASSGIKQKSQLLMQYLAKPGFNTISDLYSYQDVIQDLPLYQDCWIRWSGMATNLNTYEEYVEFDFLVGYDSRTKLEGIVPVKFNSFVSFDISHPLEILAQVKIKNNTIVLEADSFFQTITPIK